MFKHIKRFTMLFIAAVSLFTVSCGKDDASKDDRSIEGKTYASMEWHWDYYNNRYYEYDVIRFISSTDFEISTRYDDPYGPMIGSLYTGKYTYSYPDLKIEYTTTTSSGTTTDHAMEFVFLNNNVFRYTSENGKVHDYVEVRSE